ncbi:MAG: SufD family Fe-S cluster assembly protein [Alphaproteobacteria bacterium]|nr:SufD family Fe-S cluster assembly protein [Alphaproteobacteria bacterium]
MSYMWNKFNIKTFPSETIVYCDGVYQPELSTITETGIINKKYDLPIHIIYVGDIKDENTLNINISVMSQPVFLSVNIKNKFPAFLNIFIKNTGKNSEIRGHIMCENSSELGLKIVAEHDAPDTGILLQTKIIGNKDSSSSASGVAIINPNCKNCRSDIRFAGHTLDKSAKIRFMPSQRILSVPEFANHSAYIFHPNDKTENYLRAAGLSGAEVKDAMVEAFINDFDLF